MTDLPDFRKLPGLKERELIALGRCKVYDKPLLQGGGVTFYKVTIARAGVDAGAIKRRYGLQLALGDSEALARVFSPDDDLAKIFDGPHEVMVHEGCAGEIRHLLQLVPVTDDAEAAP